MTWKEYKEILEYEVYRGEKVHCLKRFQIKHIRPNTNCMYLSRTMWFFFNRGVLRVISRMIYVRIIHRYGCCIFPSAKVDRGFWIEHPVGIVIGNCIIGKEFTIHQNTTIGVKHRYDDSKGLIPKIGEFAHMCANSCVLGDVSVCDGVTIGAGAVVNKNIDVPGTYVGVPARLVKASGGYENTNSL